MISRVAVSRPPRDDEGFAPGERVVFIPNGTRATVHLSAGGYSHVYWDDEPDLGGSRVRDELLRREQA